MSNANFGDNNIPVSRIKPPGTHTYFIGLRLGTITPVIIHYPSSVPPMYVWPASPTVMALIEMPNHERLGRTSEVARSEDDNRWFCTTFRSHYLFIDVLSKIARVLPAS